MKALSKVKDKLRYCGLLLSTTAMTAMSNVTTALAGDTESTDTELDGGGGAGATGIFTDNTKAMSLISQIADIYKVWSLPFIFITIILWAITKDDKKKELEKKVLIGLIAVYLLCFIYTTVFEGLLGLGNSLAD